MNHVTIINANELFRQSLSLLINTYENFSVEEVYSNLDDFLSKYAGFEVHTVLLDYDKKITNYAEQLLRLRRSHSDVKVILMSNTIKKDKIIEFSKMGVSGFCTKSLSPGELEFFLHEVSDNMDKFQVKFDSTVKETIVRNEIFGVMEEEFEVKFSEREIEVLQLICRERTNLEIASILGLSIRTIESHRRRMIERTDRRSIIGVILYAIKQDIPLQINSFELPGESNFYQHLTA